MNSLKTLRDSFFYNKNTEELDLKLLDKKDNFLFIPSCEKRLNLVRGGKVGGEKSKPTPKPTPKPNMKPTPKQKKLKVKEKKDIKDKFFFSESEIFDKNKFAEIFKDWTKSKMAYYFDAAARYSNEGNKYVDWAAAIHNWAKKDELQGKIKFNVPLKSNHDTDGIL